MFLFWIVLVSSFSPVDIFLNQMIYLRCVSCNDIEFLKQIVLLVYELINFGLFYFHLYFFLNEIAASHFTGFSQSF